MSEPFVAQIQIVGFNFPPVGWAECNGQLIAISQNTALFSLLGTFYGGDGRSNFALPNLQGMSPVHAGNGPGLTPIAVGQTGGSSTVTLTTTEIPSHTHPVTCNPGMGDQYGPQGNFWATDAGGNNEYASGSPNATMAPGAIATAGSSQPHNNMQPYLVLNFIIAMQGIFPSRS